MQSKSQELITAGLIADFEQVNSYGKYRSDLEEFIRGSRYEDFYSDDRETVFISTIHKAKGREFDSIYLLLDHVPLQSDADRRKLYVGLTRAKITSIFIVIPIFLMRTRYRWWKDRLTLPSIRSWRRSRFN